MCLINELDILNEELLLEKYSTPSIEKREELYQKYKAKLEINKSLNRSLISFQSNKTEPLYRWFKYKEGFSSEFVAKMLEQFGNPSSGQTVLDPFAGIGTTITTSIKLGFNAIGIELLSPGVLATEARIAATKLDKNKFKQVLKEIEQIEFENRDISKEYFFQHITITRGAFSEETEYAIANINKYINENCDNVEIKSLLKFAVSSILEEVSYTRKDGQYLRWDYRSPRQLKSQFNKGKIHSFKARIIEKLNIILKDIDKVKQNQYLNNHRIIRGSSLTELHKIHDNSVDIIITSPPYCNRYDYTRTYALELAFDGINDGEIKKLRQTLLSATVENKSKFFELKKFYTSIGKEETFQKIVESYQNEYALKEVILSLNYHKKELNNKNIPDMVRNYFFEMNFIIQELSRVLKTGGKVIMVNDNVRYNGDEIPVDLILSEFAEDAGLKTENIWVLERGKGNSSQQMGTHGRKELRKCIYVWSK